MSYGYKKGYNPQKYAENRKAEKERTYQMIDDTAIEVYSAANTLLIFKQIPNATQLKSFEDWNKDGVKVRQKQKSIAILEPVEYTKSDGTLGLGYNVKRVFDRSQTNSKREAVQKTEDLKHTLKNFVNASPVEIVVGEIPSVRSITLKHSKLHSMKILPIQNRFLSVWLKRLHLLSLPTVKNHIAVEMKALRQFALHI